MTSSGPDGVAKIPLTVCKYQRELSKTNSLVGNLRDTPSLLFVAGGGATPLFLSTLLLKIIREGITFSRFKITKPHLSIRENQVSSDSALPAKGTKVTTESERALSKSRRAFDRRGGFLFETDKPQLDCNPTKTKKNRIEVSMLLMERSVSRPSR